MTAIVTLQDVNAKIDILTKAILSNKQTLSIEEAACYAALSVSYLYKLTSTRAVKWFILTVPNLIHGYVKTALKQPMKSKQPPSIIC